MYGMESLGSGFCHIVQAVINKDCFGRLNLEILDQFLIDFRFRLQTVNLPGHIASVHKTKEFHFFLTSVVEGLGKIGKDIELISLLFQIFQPAFCIRIDVDRLSHPLKGFTDLFFVYRIVADEGLEQFFF